MSTALLKLFCVLWLAAFVAPAWATASSANFRMQSNSLEGSGGVSASSQFVVNSCLGAAVVGTSSSNSFRLDAGCAALASIPSAVDGFCASPTPSLFAPDSTNLCTAGTAGLVSSGVSGWGWSCSGSNGGSTASCSAPYAGTATGSGNGWASLGGTAGWVVDPTQTGFIASGGFDSLPAGYLFPHGLFKVRLINGPVGTAASVTIHFPAPLPAGTVYWKYGPTQNNATPHWHAYPGAVISGATVTLNLTDGADGDADLLANSVIVDPGGPGIPDPQLRPIPTLSEWTMLLLIALTAFLTWLMAYRHRSERGLLSEHFL